MTSVVELTPPQEVEEASKSRKKKASWVPLLLVFLGVLVLLYPVISTNYNNIKQRQFANEYAVEMRDIPQEVKDAELIAARNYNASLSGIPILDPYLKDVNEDPGTAAYQQYLEQLNLTETMARVRVPEVNISLPVYHDTTDDVIAKGAGHLYGTALPVGGVGTHAVLTSHTGMSNATLFDNLIDVEIGDIMFVDVLDETLAYRVDNIDVVLPDEIEGLTAVPGKDYLTLFTCTPYSVNSHRLLVRGERIDWTPDVAAISEQSQPLFEIQTWMWWFIGGSLAGLVLVLAMAAKERKKKKAKAQVSQDDSADSVEVGDQDDKKETNDDLPYDSSTDGDVDQGSDPETDAEITEYRRPRGRHSAPRGTMDD